MENIYSIKGQLQKVYAAYSKFIDKGVQFLLALVTFYMINHDLGFMEILSNPLITLGLAVICAFLPMIFTALAAAALILVQMASVSLGIAAVTAAVFLIMFIFYVRFSPRMAVYILLTALAFLCHIPFVAPVAFGLMAGPAVVIPLICGTVAYYMIDYVETSASALKGGEEGMIGQLMEYLKQVFQNKEMIVMLIALIIVTLLVYQLHRLSVNHAWKTASAAGAVAGIVIVAAGSAMLGVNVSYPELLIGSVAAVAVGLVLELAFFAVDYSRTESVQYEDDEYYYYVKAVPKILVAAPEKTVKRINRRSADDAQETEIIDTEQIRRKAAPEEDGEIEDEAEQKRPKAGKKKGGRKKAPHAKAGSIEGSITGALADNVDELLLTKRLQEELSLDSDKNNE